MAGNPLLNSMTKPKGDPRFGQFGAGGTSTAHPYGQQTYGNYQQPQYGQNPYGQQQHAQPTADELNQMYGAYNAHEASLDHNLHMLGLKTDSMLELTYTERKRVHNLKYYTWVEQQQMNVEDLNAQWYDTKGTWDAVHAQAKDLDELINEFNEATGLLKAL